MSNARQIKQRIKTSQNISKITKAMEMVSASKMRRAQAQALATRPYTRALQDSLQKLASSSSSLNHPFLSTNDRGFDVAVIISTDKGLCGGLNQNLFKKTIEWQKNTPNSKLVVIGKKAVAFARIYGLDVYAQFTELPDTIKPGDILGVTTLVTEQFTNEEFKSVSVIYMDFISTLVQKVRQIQLLPLRTDATTEMQDDSKDEDENKPTSEIKSEYIFEPSAQEILGDLLNYYLENTVYQSFLEAKASEHSARMVAMKNASENAGELKHELQLKFNKSRQAAITSELLDITTAVLAQKSKQKEMGIL
jgi:F-type H+-transporting ATPase subunit gamma